MASSHPPFNNVHLFQLGKLPVRGRLVMCDHVTQDITGRHDYPSFIAKPLSEALAFGAIMSSTLKEEAGIFTLQIRGDGPLSLMVVDANGQGHMRGYAQYNGDGHPQKLRDMIGDAQLVFTLDGNGGAKQRYQGVVEMVGDNLTDSLQHYFTQSEQSRTALKLLSTDDGKVSGIYLQWMPSEDGDVDEDRENWLYVLSLLSTLDEKEFIAGNVKPEELLYRLFHDQDLQIDKVLPLEARCRCSRERIEIFLDGLKPKEREEFVKEGEISVTCEFCSRNYLFEK